MILLESEILMVKEVLQKRLNTSREGKPEILEVRLTDDDGNLYYIHTVEKDKTRIAVEFGSKIFNSVKSLDVVGRIDQVYKDYEKLGGGQVSAGYDIGYVISYDKVAPGDQANQAATLFAGLRFQLYKAVFSVFFDNMAAGKESSVLLTVRPNEQIFVHSKSDRVTVTYALEFNSDEDIIVGKIFLQEFKEGKKAGGANAPSVIVTYKEPPAECAGEKGVIKGPKVSYVTMVLIQTNVAEKNRDKTVAALQNFIPYLKYHMKCSYAYLHSRMRAKTDDFVKVLNRARPVKESSGVKKGYGGKLLKGVN